MKNADAVNIVLFPHISIDQKETHLLFDIQLIAGIIHGRLYGFSYNGVGDKERVHIVQIVHLVCDVLVDLGELLHDLLFLVFNQYVGSFFIKEDSAQD